jgi:DNA polymerase-3 subunit alpha (Gram-positive type)
MTAFLQSEEFKKLEVEYPFLRRAREQVLGLRAIDFVIVDIETTGLDPELNEITEIAALRVVKGEIRDAFASLIRIGRPLPGEIIRLTGITDDMLRESGRDKGEVLRGFLSFVKDTPLIAHNVEFDVPFLSYHLKQGLAATLKNPLVCTLRLSRKLIPGLPSHKLGSVAEYFKIPTPLTHRASADVEITYQLWLKLIELLEKQGISKLEDVLKIE